MARIFHILLLAFILTLPVPSAATPLSDEGQLIFEYRKKDIEKVKEEAAAGNVNAQYELGYRYMHAQGVKADILEGEKWFLKAAEQNQKNAQFELANAYLFTKRHKNTVIKMDLKKGIELLEKAADNGHPIAIDTLARFYLDGHQIVEKDISKGIEILVQGAEKGYGEHANRLAVMCDDGTYVKKDMEQAIYWYKKAVSLGYGEAQYRLNEILGTNTPIPNKKDIVEITNPAERLEVDEIVSFDFYIYEEILDCQHSGQIRAECICELYDEIDELDMLVEDFAQAHPEYTNKEISYKKKSNIKLTNSHSSSSSSFTLEGLQSTIRQYQSVHCE